MVTLMAGTQPDEWKPHETYYQTKYKIWNGYVQRLPVLRQIVDMRAASVFSSWMTKGPHDNQATNILKKMQGRGQETFEAIMANMYKIAYICGDSYAVKVYDKEMIEDLHILPSDNIRQIIEKGKIKHFEEIDSGAGQEKRQWKPYEIFHLRYMPRGAITHGMGMIEGMQSLLLGYEQMIQLGEEIYTKMARPREIIKARTDNSAKLQLIRDAIKEAGDTWSGIAVMPGTLIEDVVPITLQVSLKPQEWIDTLSKEIFKSTATPELVLGTGYSTSEEDAKTRIAGYIQSIRFDQNWAEQSIKKQLFSEMWPSNPPDIKFSFANEAPDESFRRNLEAIPLISADPTIAPENKAEIIKERLEEMGLIQ